ncbi:MAG: alpha-galactosidase [Candidatus Latescibacterota bacterium]|nr:alpha-galactosidase [Candidatus Latescibacterota bacterium]MEE3261587.1 alpha-galactosidase [Candidatus Latescibacterota bacterium]MEE3337738.1 alpha-galactosidase [Candidatus Latescibacterota bacterium]
MAKVVFIGAGSFGFTRGLVRDLLTFDLLSDAEIALVDINKQRLDFARRACQKIVDQGGYGAKVTATLNRRDALKGADAVCVTILSGSTSVWQHDILIPKYYGIDTNVGDTRGPSGIFRALRTIPEMVAIARDMEQLCPRAMMLNYTNPMAMLCHAMNRQTSIQLTGLCHSVQGTAGMIERWLKLKPGSMEYTCAGINHMAWYLSLEHRGRDLYPRLKKAMADKSVYDHEQVRNEMFLALGYYVTESSGHNSEYNWWFRKRPDLIKRYCRDGTGWNPGQYAYILKAYRNREGGGWQKSVRQWLNQDQVDLTRGHEYAASIINAYMGGDLYRFNGNVANNGLIDNLPTGACVEVPVLASSKGLEPVRVGSLPASVAMLTGLSAQIEMMAVDGSLKGDAELVYQAIAHDPLTAAKLSLAEIRKMVKEMFRKNEKWLPQFKKVNL